MASRNQLFLGTFIYSKKLDELEYLHETAVFVDKKGKIVHIEKDCNGDRARETVFPKLGWKADEVIVQSSQEGQFFFPGFIDTHIHASQYPNVGIFGKSTLLDWLNKYTFPLEASLADLAKARKVYTRCIRKTLAHGTTCAAYFATVDVASTNLLADLCLAAGQRALVGRVCMDCLSPEWYRDESPEAGVAAARASVEYIQRATAAAAAADDAASETPLVRPIITPRFAPSCSAELLRGLGRLASETRLPVQTHISENRAEVSLVSRLFPEQDSYAAVYDACGLLTERTILAHGVHLSREEAELVARRGAGVSHCPCSNSAITSGAARVRWLLDCGVRCGLGTDVSGGFSPSVLEAARQANLVSRHVAMSVDGDDDGERAKLSVEEVLYLATRGGADLVGLGDRVGAFEVGRDWDAQLIGLGRVTEDGSDIEGVAEGQEEDGNVDLFGWETWEEVVAKWLFNGDDRNTKKVWVRGRLVHERK